jgi:hypothetical protein
VRLAHLHLAHCTCSCTVPSVQYAPHTHSTMPCTLAHGCRTVWRRVRKPPSWPRSWTNFSLFLLHARRNARANLHFLGQPNSLLASGAGGLPAAEPGGEGDDRADAGGAGGTRGRGGARSKALGVSSLTWIDACPEGLAVLAQCFHADSAAMPRSRRRHQSTVRPDPPPPLHSLSHCPPQLWRPPPHAHQRSTASNQQHERTAQAASVEGALWRSFSPSPVLRAAITPPRLMLSSPPASQAPLAHPLRCPRTAAPVFVGRSARGVQGSPAESRPVDASCSSTAALHAHWSDCATLANIPGYFYSQTLQMGSIDALLAYA